MNVINRDNLLIEFNSTRIFNAIKSAFNACNFPISNEEIQKLVDEIPVWDGIHVEDIQDEVEEVLMDYGYNEVAKEYILYRADRELIRNRKDKLTKKISEKLAATNVQNQNANVDEYSFGGRIGEASRVVTKEYALNNCMSTMARENHLNNEIYIHDLDSYAVGMHNCLTLPLDDLLANGATIKSSDIRPAGSINTAFQLVAVYFQTQSLNQFGGISASHFDWTMVPYVRKSFKKHYKTGLKYLVCQSWDPAYDKAKSINDAIFLKNDEVYAYALEMTKNELHQAVEGMYHNLNTLLSRSGN